MEHLQPPPLPDFALDKKNQNVVSCSEICQPNESLWDALEWWTKVYNIGKQQFLITWQETPTILQNGPQCGLVALAMAGQSYGLKFNTDMIFQMAKSIGVTKYGEIFSSNAMCDLAKKMNLRYALLNEGFIDAQVLLEYILSGKKLLIPYDADCNHSPCLKNGHKAHWALIVGAAFHYPDSESLHHSDNSCCTWKLLRENIYEIRRMTPGCKVSSRVNRRQIYLLAKQGKSKRLAIWSYESLESSNKNLEEVDPKRRSSDFVLPLDNKLTDLRGKIIVLG